MANEVFIVQCRNDLPDGLVQYTDVSPNTSQRNASIDPPGQTGYIDAGQVRDVDNTFHWRLEQGDQPTLTSPNGDGIINSGTSAVDGLIAWLIWNIECNGNGGQSAVMSTRQATACAQGIINRVVAGQSLTAADLATLINDRGAAVALMVVAGTEIELVPNLDPDIAASGTNGRIGTNTGKTTAELVEEIVRLVSGDTFRLLANTPLSTNNGGAMNWDGVDHSSTASAAFLTAPNTNTTAAQTFPMSTDFRERRRLFLSGSIASSAQAGKLSIYRRTQDTVLNGGTGFAYEAARLPSGQVATYGGGTAVRFAGSGVAEGTARGLSVVNTITGITAVNGAVVTTAAPHGLISTDIVRIRGVVNGALPNPANPAVQLNGQHTVTFISPTTFSINVNNVVGNNGVIPVPNTGTANLSQAGANHIDIPDSGIANKQFRGIMVYSSDGAVL